jgi:hypothetical protein
MGSLADSGYFGRAQDKTALPPGVLAVQPGFRSDSVLAFDLNGKFTYMPEFEGTKNFPTPSDDLRQISLAQWGPFIFASLAPEIPFDEWFRPVPERLNWLPIKAARFDATRSRDYLVNCNWTLYCENYLEGFHIPFVHAGLADGLDFGNYRTELFEHSNVQVGIARGGEPALTPPPGSIDQGQQVAGYFFWLFPNLMFNVYPWGISVNIVRPLAVDRTRVSFLSYVWDASKIEIGVGGQLERHGVDDRQGGAGLRRNVSTCPVGEKRDRARTRADRNLLEHGIRRGIESGDFAVFFTGDVDDAAVRPNRDAFWLFADLGCRDNSSGLEIDHTDLRRIFIRNKEPATVGRDVELDRHPARRGADGIRASVGGGCVPVLKGEVSL